MGGRAAGGEAGVHTYLDCYGTVHIHTEATGGYWVGSWLARGLARALADTVCTLAVELAVCTKLTQPRATDLLLSMLRRSALSLLPRAARGLCGAAAPMTINRTWSPTSQRVGALGMKCGMTQAWAADGKRVPITVVEVQDLQVTKVRTPMHDGVCALQLGGGWQKRKRLTFPEARSFETNGLSYKSYLREFNVTEDALLPIGTSITARHFVPGQYVDVQGVTRGKGFAGAMKRWGFKGQPATHGHSLSHRSVGSMGGAAGSMYATRVWKGKKMPGRMGGKRRTARALMVWKVVPEYDLLYVLGSVPGARGSIVRVRDTKVHKRGFKSPPPFPTFLPGDAEGADESAELLAPRASGIEPAAAGSSR